MAEKDKNSPEVLPQSPSDSVFGGTPEKRLGMGRTPPAPDPNTDKPEDGAKPKGGSGRVSVDGFVSWDELNPKLVGNQGLLVFDEMWRTDGDIKRLVIAVSSPIQAASWTVEPYGGDDASPKDEEAADLCRWALWEHMKPNFIGHLVELLPVLFRSGYSDFEHVWESSKWHNKTVLVPKTLGIRLPKTVYRWWEDDWGMLTGLTQFLPNAANVYIPIGDLLHYRLGPEGNNWVGTSLLRSAYGHWYLKSRLERIDAIGQERKAVGLPIAYPPMNADTETREEFEAVLANTHTNPVSYIMAPGPKAGTVAEDAGAWFVDVISFDSSSGDTISTSIELQTKKIVSSIMADYLELGHHNVGARATAQVQEDPFLTSVEAIAAMVKAPLQEFVSRIAHLNFDGLEGAPELVMSLRDTTSLTEIAEFASKLTAEGLLKPDRELEEYLRNKIGFPAHNPEEDVANEKRAQEEHEAKIAAVQNPAKLNDRLNKAEKKTKGAPGNSASEEAEPTRLEKKTLDAADGDPVGSEAWYEKLLEQGRLKEALDNARDEVISDTQTATTALAIDASKKAKRKTVRMVPPDDLTEALTKSLEKLYGVGYSTVQDEMRKQHEARGEMAPAPTHEHKAGLLAVQKRAAIAANYATNEVVRSVEQESLNEHSTPLSLQRSAEAAAQAAIRKEALQNAPATINHGRRDAAVVAAGTLAALKSRTEDSEAEIQARTGVTPAEVPAVKGIYTSVLDDRSCDPCLTGDDGEERELDDPALTVPNPECNGGAYCRCTVVYVLSGEGSNPLASE